MAIARIVIPQEKVGNAHKTVGTKVLVDGCELQKVTRIVIRGCTDDVWRAEIHALVAPPEEICADAVVYVHDQSER